MDFQFTFDHVRSPDGTIWVRISIGFGPAGFSFMVDTESAHTLSKEFSERLERAAKAAEKNGSMVSEFILPDSN